MDNKKLVQLQYGNLILCMYADDWQIYHNTQFAKDGIICEYTKTGRIKKNSERQNKGVEFIKYIDLADLYIDVSARETIESKIEQLNQIHDKIIKGEIFNFQSHNWMPRGFTKSEGKTNKIYSQKEYNELMKDYNPAYIPSLADTIIENIQENPWNKII